MAFRDLREWLEQVNGIGELASIPGANWEEEIGALTEIACRTKDGPAVLFDRVPGYPQGFRVLANMMGSRKRLGLTFDLPLEMNEVEMVREWRRRFKELKSIPPRMVEGGPVMQNVLRGDQVDILKFPAPKWHESDGGRVIGTADAFIVKDPDSDWVNLGTYTVQVQDERHLTVAIGKGHNGHWLIEKWFAQGKRAPIALVVGVDPVLFTAATTNVAPNSSEYDLAGAIQGRPVEVVPGPVTGLPIPAYAEIVLEGFVDPQKKGPQGPWGDWPGYYLEEVAPRPLIEIEGICYRNDPILTGAPPIRPPHYESHNASLMIHLGLLLEVLEKAGVPEVTGVWRHVQGDFFTVVAIKQKYAGQARQAGRIAAQCAPSGTIGRYTVVVDDDIDVSNLDEVLWAICTRVDPQKDIEVLTGCRVADIDPIHPLTDRFTPRASRVVIDATRPYEWRDRFPKVTGFRPELRQSVMERFGALLNPKGAS
jgi:4-hydroxy-3-polyprenylbenzoate decarboxylase